MTICVTVQYCDLPSKTSFLEAKKEEIGNNIIAKANLRSIHSTDLSRGLNLGCMKRKNEVEKSFSNTIIDYNQSVLKDFNCTCSIPPWIDLP